MIEFRSFRDPDLAQIVNLKNALNRATGTATRSTVEEIDEEFSAPYVSRSTDVFCAEENGLVIGYAHTYFIDSTEREVRCYVFGGTHPDHMRRGVGTTLTTMAMGRARELLDSGHVGLPRRLRADITVGDDASAELLASLGFSPVRWFHDLARPLDALPDVIAPEGIRIVGWDTARNEELRIVKNSAFADHWGSTPTSPEGWHQMTDGWGSRTDVSFMAVDDNDEIVGLLLSHRYPSDDDLLGSAYGWIDKIATAREHRGRGIASSLINTALHAYATEGWTHAALNADGDNPTGAFRLYGSLGFVPFRGTVNYEFGS
ncbi:MAG: GNAT family N-acetyltransferase [Actinobacteria bacterium]|nr:GNAT family N-acetyltransferase [Actinomycetota bacterium]